jgi:pyruvate/2-oxoglutarate dehydrogenase complex dihydrolipoamide acyltransferase (E2) component
LTSLIARHSTTTTAPTKKPAPPAATAKPAHAATAATPASTAAAAPKKPTNATAVWNPVVSRRTNRNQQVYPPAERRIVVQLVEAPNDAQKAADTALRTINRALVGQPDVTVPPLYTTYVSRTNALVFTAGPRHRGRDYEPFLGIIRNALAEIPTISAHVSQLWSRYVVNGIPTTTTPDDAREEIEWLYPAAKLAKAPR